MVSKTGPWTICSFEVRSEPGRATGSRDLENALPDAVCCRPADEGGARGDAKGSDLVLEIRGEEAASVIVAEPDTPGASRPR